MFKKVTVTKNKFTLLSGYSIHYVNLKVSLNVADGWLLINRNDN